MTKQSSQKALPERPDRGARNEGSIELELKAINQDTGSCEFYCSRFGNVDHQGDVIIPGAFKNLDAFISDGWLAYNHQISDPPLALIDSAFQDSNGLKVTAKFHSTPEAQKIRTIIAERLSAGKKVKCSFGYRVLDASMEMRDGEPVRLLKALEIYEASIVNLAANDLAGVTRIKSNGDLIGLNQAAGFISEIKAGRVLSAANHKQLCKFAKGLHEHGTAACDMAANLKDFLAQHGDVDDDETTRDDDSGESDDSESEESKSEQDALALKRQRLALQAGILSLHQSGV